MKLKQLFLMTGLTLIVASAQAGAGAAGHAHHSMHMNHGGTQAGEAGLHEDVSRVVAVEAIDRMRFLHESLKVRAGETIQFNVINTGKIRHEFAIGLKEEHAAHQKMMRQMPTMVHDEPNAVTLGPGEKKTLIWKFSEAGVIEVACNIPGHYQAGMLSRISVE